MFLSNFTFYVRHVQYTGGLQTTCNNNRYLLHVWRYVCVCMFLIVGQTAGRSSSKLALVFIQDVFQASQGQGQCQDQSAVGVRMEAGQGRGECAERKRQRRDERRRHENGGADSLRPEDGNCNKCFIQKTVLVWYEEKNMHKYCAIVQLWIIIIYKTLKDYIVNHHFAQPHFQKEVIFCVDLLSHYHRHRHI